MQCLQLNSPYCKYFSQSSIPKVNIKLECKVARITLNSFHCAISTAFAVLRLMSKPSSCATSGARVATVTVISAIPIICVVAAISARFSRMGQGSAPANDGLTSFGALTELSDRLSGGCKLHPTLPGSRVVLMWKRVQVTSHASLCLHLMDNPATAWQVFVVLRLNHGSGC
jgi:hypothetical protein